MGLNVSRIKKVLSQNVINIPGFRTKRKIVVIESDDWGSIRMPSKQVLNRFKDKGFDIANSDYNRLDTLESNDDLLSLFQVLNSHIDSKGNPAVITANVVMGNPDFDKIRESDFSQYYVEPVAKTLETYPGRDRVLSLWKEGDIQKVFHPQFHAREHVNVIRWMEALRKKTAEIMFTFEHRTTFSGVGDYNFMEVLDYNTPKDLVFMKESLREGLDLFADTFGFRSKSFIPPCYAWDSHVEKTLADNGVKYIQGLFVQSVPTGTFDVYGKKYHFMGSKNNYGQRYLMRNCFFEPSLAADNNSVDECIRRIGIAFQWNKPAIISSHRINFMGSLDPQNREDNLKRLNDLLAGILRQWPEVEFMTSDQLGDMIVNGA
ncbi:hypothetical protein [Saccharicrinis fermentans]|uniref:Polysaccharide (De)acetylase n=1 Tax=Saccharicrinis fermentans DSM 9555 = JCM 21142 TaxID=869213 RepID=W7Y594_9BACT|nr:hypothetical protein [Saccharicrinis fermentans]GAF03252.1 hypothetical protein JCM21142_41919 [Saccharicrinis fermentans DSM 9555 = JCM 21142]